MMNLSYDYDTRRMLDFVQNQNRYTVDYQYDGLGRLSGATGTAADMSWEHANSYSFDAGDRMLVNSTENYEGTMGLPGTTDAPAFFEKVALDGSGDIYRDSFAYNDLGEMKQVTTQVNTVVTKDRLFDFNADGTLGGVVDSDLSVQVQFKYDAGRNRVYKRIVDGNGIKDESFYLFALFTESSGVKRNHVSDGMFVVASRVAGNGNIVIYPVTNHQGSTIMTTNASGRVLSETAHDPYGNVWSQTESDSAPDFDT